MLLTNIILSKLKHNTLHKIKSSKNFQETQPETVPRENRDRAASSYVWRAKKSRAKIRENESSPPTPAQSRGAMRVYPYHYISIISILLPLLTRLTLVVALLRTTYVYFLAPLCPLLSAAVRLGFYLSRKIAGFIFPSHHRHQLRLHTRRSFSFCGSQKSGFPFLCITHTYTRVYSVTLRFLKLKFVDGRISTLHMYTHAHFYLR